MGCTMKAAASPKAGTSSVRARCAIAHVRSTAGRTKCPRVQSVGGRVIGHIWLHATVGRRRISPVLFMTLPPSSSGMRSHSGPTGHSRPGTLTIMICS